MTTLQELGTVPAHADAGIAGGLSAPAWVIALIGAAVVLGGIGYFLWRARPRRKVSWSGSSSKGR
jgi:hypothetical protein